MNELVYRRMDEEDVGSSSRKGKEEERRLLHAKNTSWNMEISASHILTLSLISSSYHPSFRQGSTSLYLFSWIVQDNLHVYINNRHEAISSADTPRSSLSLSTNQNHRKGRKTEHVYIENHRESNLESNEPFILPAKRKKTKVE